MRLVARSSPGLAVYLDLPPKERAGKRTPARARVANAAKANDSWCCCGDGFLPTQGSHRGQWRAPRRRERRVQRCALRRLYFNNLTALAYQYPNKLIAFLHQKCEKRQLQCHSFIHQCYSQCGLITVTHYQKKYQLLFLSLALPAE